MPWESLVELLEYFRRFGSDTACMRRVGYRMVRWSYAGVLATASRIARELEARVVAKGDRVLLWGENSPEWVAAFWGCVLRGAVVVPMDRIAAPDFARRVGDQVQAKLAIGSRQQVEQLSGISALVFESFADVLPRHSAAEYRLPELRGSDPLQIIFTSGTTAEPKGVVITHGNVLANLEPIEGEIERYRKWERLFHPLRFLNLLPLSHVFGQFMGLFVPPLIGAMVIFQDSLNPTEIIQTIKRERISALIAVPRLLESLRDRLEQDFAASGQLDRVRAEMERASEERFLKRWWRFRRVHRIFGQKFWALISGGAALPRDTEEFWRRLGYAVVQGYGLTETTSLISAAHPFKLSRGSIGKVLPGREMKLDPETGEILVRGESVTSGYWQEGKIKPVPGEEGWLRTGDIGALDAEGNLYFKGRKKEVIVTPEGFNVYPEDLEGALRRQPEVRDAVVTGLEREGNAVPCAVLLMRAAGDPGAAVHRANKSLAEYQQIRHWFVWPDEDFPRTSTHKPRMNAIAEFARAQAGVAVPPEAAGGGTLARLIEHVTQRRVGALPPDANLATDLNLSSIERVELMSALEDRYQIDLNEARFSEAGTIGDVERMIRATRDGMAGEAEERGHQPVNSFRNRPQGPVHRQW
jgi:long-chain acyl-CoA synthetase